MNKRNILKEIRKLNQPAGSKLIDKAFKSPRHSLSLRTMCQGFLFPGKSSNQISFHSYREEAG